MRFPAEDQVERSATAARTFRAPSPRAALDAVKRALGSDAVIESCREVQSSLFGGHLVEVVARPPALPVDDARARRGAATPRLARELAARAFAPPRIKGGAEHRGGLSSSSVSVPEVQGRPAGARADDAQLRTTWAAELVERGLDYQLATGMLDDAGALHDRAVAVARLALRAREMVASARPPWALDPTSERTIVALVGPTGVGKTTTAAKIAARAIVERRLRVALITLDTHRVGAAGQLLGYAHALDVPAWAAANAEELERALEESADYDLVVVDTAGRSPNDHVLFAHQRSLLVSIPAAQLCLAVAAGTAPAVLSRVRERYLPLGPERLIVTKLDEACGPGAAFATAARFDLPVSCLTDGQRIPEDLRAARPDEICAFLAEP